MYKKKLQRILIELYFNKNISSSKFLVLSNKLEKISEGDALAILYEGPSLAAAKAFFQNSFFSEPLETTIKSKPFLALKKYTGIKSITDLTKRIKLQKGILTSSSKDSPEWNAAKKQINALRLQRAKILGIQTGVTVPSVYAGKKLATRNYNQKEIKNAYNRNRY